MTTTAVQPLVTSLVKPLLTALAGGVGEGGGVTPGGSALDAASAVAVFGTSKLVEEYTGNALRLRHSSNNQELDFGYMPSGVLDTASINAWLGSYAYTLPGDVDVLYQGYALRQVRTAYTGPLVRIRRSSDNAELDINPTGSGTLDSVAVLNHCGAGDGYIVTWYDQSGNGRDATQTVLAEQPKLVAAGVMIASTNGKPAVEFDGTNDFLVCSNVGALNSDFNFFTVLESTSSAEQFIISRRAAGGDITTTNYFFSLDPTRKPRIVTYDTADTLFSARGSTSLPASTPALIEASFKNDRLRMRVNGHEEGSKSFNNIMETGGVQVCWIGRDPHSGTYHFQGNIQEMLLYYRDVSDDRDAIMGNMNAATAAYVRDAYVVRWYNQLDGSFYQQLTTANQPQYSENGISFDGNAWLEGADTSAEGNHTVICKLDNTSANATHTVWSNAGGVAVQSRTVSNVCGYRYDSGSGITQVTGGIAQTGPQLLAWDLGISTAGVGEIRRNGSVLASGLGYQPTVLTGISRLGNVTTGAEGFEGTVETLAVLQQTDTAALESLWVD